ncbi:MAG: hypothetical protein IK126_02695 [Bacteroidales bacterium]|nr:hypothetical protein [Bacteroidales bacterium]
MVNYSLLKKILTTLMSIAFVSLLSAQEASVSKQINQIKRNTQYVYSEATMENESDAMEMAYELLIKQVQEYVASKKKLNSSENILIKDIKTKSESMSMMRGTMHRVFVYVKKSDIEGVVNTTVINSDSGVTIKVSDSPATIVDIQQTTPTTENTPSFPQSILSEKTQTILADSVTPNIPIQNETMEQVQHKEISVPQDASDNSAVPQLAGWKKSAIESLLTCNDMAAARAKLNRMKAEYKVKRYGSPDKCPSLDKVFWVIFDDKGCVITVLCPGDEQLIDYKMRQYVSLSHYNNKNAIWFQLSN